MTPFVWVKEVRKEKTICRITWDTQAERSVENKRYFFSKKPCNERRVLKCIGR